ncbi:MAG: flagellar basal-body rod protein FlgF [Proteobacteria bacterium]|nr:flagellar basal-body rod protein FlgF [Pseudomonadota bacterium]
MADISALQLSHMLATLRSMDIVANNLANSSTPGFKRDAIRFEEVLKREQPAEDEVGPQMTSFVREAGVSRDLRQGPIVTTNAPFDLAINGDGFFSIQTPAGVRYTRNGHFELDASGRVATSDGGILLAEGGPIVVAPEDGDIHVAQDGIVSGKRGQIARLQLVGFAHAQLLRKEGASLYAASEAPSAATGRILQGGVENSNVEPVIEIARMIEIMRAYQTTANLIQAQEKTEGDTLARLAKMP